VESSKRSNDLQDSVCDSESYVAQRERRLEHNFHPKITKFLLLRDIQRPTVALIVKPATESSRKNTDPTHPLELQIPIPTSYPLRRPGFVAVGARRPIPRLSSSRLVASIITPPPSAFTPAPSSPTPHSQAFNLRHDPPYECSPLARSGDKLCLNWSRDEEELGRGSHDEGRHLRPGEAVRILRRVPQQQDQHPHPPRLRVADSFHGLDSARLHQAPGAAAAAHGRPALPPVHGAQLQLRLHRRLRLVLHLAGAQVGVAGRLARARLLGRRQRRRAARALGVRVEGTVPCFLIDKVFFPSNVMLGFPFLIGY
jgi:hypothetical protein